MRRVALLIGVIIGTAIGGFVASVWLIDTVAQERREIRIEVQQTAPTDASTGDRCSFDTSATSRESLSWPISQVIIRDANGAIVEVAYAAEGTYQPASDTSDTIVCRLSLETTLPHSPFYSVYLDDEWVHAIDSVEDGGDGAVIFLN